MVRFCPGDTTVRASASGGKAPSGPVDGATVASRDTLGCQIERALGLLRLFFQSSQDIELGGAADIAAFQLPCGVIKVHNGQRQAWNHDVLIFLALLDRLPDSLLKSGQRLAEKWNFLLLLAQPRRQPRQAGIDPIKEVFFVTIFICRGRQNRVHQLVVGESITGFYRPASRPLRKLMPQTLHCELNVGHANERIDPAGIELDRVVLRRTGHRAKPANIADVEFFRLPGKQAFFDLFRETIRGRPPPGTLLW